MLLQTFWINKTFPLPEPQTGLGAKFSQADRVFLMRISPVVDWKNTPCNVLYFLFFPLRDRKTHDGISVAVLTQVKYSLQSWLSI